MYKHEPGQITQLIAATRRIRDQALLSLSADSGVKSSELADIQVRDLEMEVVGFRCRARRENSADLDPALIPSSCRPSRCGNTQARIGNELTPQGLSWYPLDQWKSGRSRNPSHQPLVVVALQRLEARKRILKWKRQKQY